ncbi:hypothetical protein Nizo2802_2271 [Lactiplantibacillus plantarum]|nr:hypothetical protein Nizo2802_2271 [Lactiplantibacillus plantarum]
MRALVYRPLNSHETANINAEQSTLRPWRLDIGVSPQLVKNLVTKKRAC